MPPTVNLPNPRRCRIYRGQRLVILLVFLSCYSWTYTRLASTSMVFLATSSSSMASSLGDPTWFRGDCSGASKPDSNVTRCGTTDRSTVNTSRAALRSVASPNDLTATNPTTNNTAATATTPGSVSTDIGASNSYRHPNFTVDFPLCLVHVGKTAGSSISCGLGLMYADCEGMPRQPAIPHVNYIHMRNNNCFPIRGNSADLDDDGTTTRHTATFLMTIRNPLTRIWSWFDFEKDRLPTRRNKQDENRLRWKRGLLFSECYDNFVDLVTNGLEPIWTAPSGSNSSNTTNKRTSEVSAERPVDMTCQERAWAAVLGVREFSYHEWYNYEHYWTMLTGTMNLYKPLPKGSSPPALPPPSLVVLRTEHLAEDWSKLSSEDLFRKVNRGSYRNGTSDADDSDSRNAFSRFVPANSSQRFWTNLCRAMCPEVKVYQQILEHADNLNKSDVVESMRDVRAMCPRYEPKECPDIPEFPSLRIPRRKYRGETKKRLFAIQ